MFRDDDQHSKKWNEDLHEYEKNKKVKPKNTQSESNKKTDNRYIQRDFNRPLRNEIEQSPFNYKTLLLLSIFVGGFGAHRFYVKRTGSAIAMLILGLISFGFFSLIWNTVDLIKILLGNFKDANNLTIKPEKGDSVKLLWVLAFFVLLISFMISVNLYGSFLSGFMSSFKPDKPLISEGRPIETVPYEFNQPIEVFGYNGENTGTITAKSARMVMGEEAMVEVTYEITKKDKDFSEEAKLFTYNGIFSSSFRYDDKYQFEESYISVAVTELLGLKNNEVSWYKQLEGTTLSVTKYYKYKPLKEKFCIGVPLYDHGKEKMATIDLMPLVEDKTIDLSVVDQRPVTKQPKVTVPLGQEKRVLMIDIKVNRSNIGKGKKLPLGTASLYEDENYVVLDVDLKNNSAVTLTEDDIFGNFELLNDDFYSEDEYFVWNEKLDVLEEPLNIKPGESKKVAFVFVTYEKLPEKEKDFYFVYNPNYDEDKKLTKFSIVE